MQVNLVCFKEMCSLKKWPLFFYNTGGIRRWSVFPKASRKLCGDDLPSPTSWFRRNAATEGRQRPRGGGSPDRGLTAVSTRNVAPPPPTLCHFHSPQPFFPQKVLLFHRGAKMCAASLSITLHQLTVLDLGRPAGGPRESFEISTVKRKEQVPSLEGHPDWEMTWFEAAKLTSP